MSMSTLVVYMVLEMVSLADIKYASVFYRLVIMALRSRECDSSSPANNLAGHARLRRVDQRLPT